jgi:hypothetical protein
MVLPMSPGSQLPKVATERAGKSPRISVGVSRRARQSSGWKLLNDCRLFASVSNNEQL